MENDNVKSELIRLLKEDGEVRHALLEALSQDLSRFADLMRRANDVYPLRVRQ